MTDRNQKHYDAGRAAEQIFLDVIAPKIGVNLAFHPDKETDPYAIDFQSPGGTVDADLKHHTGPVKIARANGLSKDHTVMLNKFQYEKYLDAYPDPEDLALFWWLDWNGRKAIYSARFTEVIRQVIHADAPLIPTRQGDKNLKAYLIDLRHCKDWNWKP